jgi:hypothetical protein
MNWIFAVVHTHGILISVIKNSKHQMSNKFQYINILWISLVYCCIIFRIHLFRLQFSMSNDISNYNVTINNVRQISPKIAESLRSGRYRVVIFGSARVKPEDILYKEVFNFAKKIGGLGCDIITGGGPGLMEAANAGHQAGTPDKLNPSLSIGLNIRLPREQNPNPELDVVENHERFSTRLDEFMMLSNIVVITPGGIGTLLELFYTWQLLQVKQLTNTPIILVGQMWKGLLEWIRENPLQHKYLDPLDMDLIIHVDTYDEAFNEVMGAYAKFKSTKQLQAL